jgi:hypothetical protein
MPTPWRQAGHQAGYAAVRTAVTLWADIGDGPSGQVLSRTAGERSFRRPEAGPVMATPELVERAAKARAQQQENAARRAIDDPVKLARAARIVRVALERQRLTVDDLLTEAGGPDAA